MTRISEAAAGASALDRLAAEAAERLPTPVAAVSLVDGRRQRLAGLHGLTGELAGARETPLSHSICQHVVRIGAPLAIEDARQTPFLADNPAVVELGVAAYLGTPLRGPDGALIGALCGIDVRPRRWSLAQRQLLADLALLAEAELGLETAAARRDEVRRRLDRLYRIPPERVAVPPAAAQSVVGPD